MFKQGSAQKQGARNLKKKKKEKATKKPQTLPNFSHWDIGHGVLKGEPPDTILSFLLEKDSSDQEFQCCPQPPDFLGTV